MTIKSGMKKIRESLIAIKPRTNCKLIVKLISSASMFWKSLENKFILKDKLKVYQASANFENNKTILNDIEKFY